jgi:hypothetical protein
MLDWSVAGCRVMSLPGGLLVAGIDDDQAKKGGIALFQWPAARETHIFRKRLLPLV